MALHFQPGDGRRQWPEHGLEPPKTERQKREYDKLYFNVPDPPNTSGLGRKHVVQACEASLRRLGVEAIDLYQLHRVDPGTPIEETLEALDLLVRQGKVRYIGCSSTWAWQLMKALAHSDARGLSRFGRKSARCFRSASTRGWA